MKLIKLHIVLGLILLCASQTNWAQAPQTEQAPGDGQQSGEHHHRGPPPAAYTACEGKTAGAAASFVNPRGDTVNGLCQADPTGKLVVRRERPQQ